MALTVINPQMKLDIPQIVELTMTRNRTGYHIFHEADGESTTNGYIFGLPSHPSGGYAEIALAVEFAPGFKTFDLRYDYHLGGNHIRYTIPRSATDKTAIVTQQFNLKDKPVEVPVKDVKVLPGVHVVRIRIDDRSSNTQFYVDEDKLIDGGILNVENANRVSIKTEKGRVFEAHFVAETDGDVFPADQGNDPFYAPRLTPGCYVVVQGEKALTPETRFVISEKSSYKKNKKKDISESYSITLPDNSQEFTYCVKFFKGYLLIDAGIGIKVISHQFTAPEHYYPTDLYTKDVLVVCS